METKASRSALGGGYCRRASNSKRAVSGQLGLICAGLSSLVFIRTTIPKSFRSLRKFFCHHLSSSPFALFPHVKSVSIRAHPWLKSFGCGFSLRVHPWLNCCF